MRARDAVAAEGKIMRIIDDAMIEECRPYVNEAEQAALKWACEAGMRAPNSVLFAAAGLRQGRGARPVTFYGGAFSQWAAAPFKLDGREWPTAEHWMMAAKARTALPGAEGSRWEADMLAGGPAEAKKLGRALPWNDRIEAAWTAKRFGVVLVGTRAKFRQHPAALDELLATGSAVIVEASPTDAVWGVGLGENDPRALDIKQWRGANLLGFALMQARSELR